MARKRRLHKRYGRKKRSSEGGGGGGFRRNPPLLKDLMEFVLPGFGAFATTRFLTRIASVQLARKKPSWGKHAGAVASIASFLAAWYGAPRVKALEKHTTPILVGSALAALQSIIQLYIPKLGWMISDASPQIAEELQLGSGTAQRALPPGLELTDDDPNEFTYNDSFDPGLYSKPSMPPSNGTQARIAAEDDLLTDLNLDEDSADVSLGSLGAN